MIELNRIYDEDCLETMARMPDNSVDLVLTDPPYGHNNNNNDMIANREAIYGGKNKVKKVAPSEYRPIANDGPEANELIRACFREFARILKSGCCCCCCCCCGGGGPDPQFARWALWLDEHIPFKQLIVWDKGPMGMGHHYRRSYETILVAQKAGASCEWYDKTRRVENIIRPGEYGITKIIPSKDQHPTQKPINLMGLFIGLHTKPGGLVFDPFIGSGTTAIAAIRAGREWVGCEIDQAFVGMARQRIDQELSQGDLFR